MECLFGSHATLQRRRKGVGLVFFFFLIYSASLHQPSVWKSSSHSSSSESVAPAGSTISTSRKRKNLKKRLNEARVAKKSKSSDTVTASVTAGSGCVDVDEEFEDCMLAAGGSPRTCGRP